MNLYIVYIALLILGGAIIYVDERLEVRIGISAILIMLTIQAFELNLF